jgi:hypothetical protein
MRKTTMILTGAAGYVLGARAGRERYEQIKAAAQRVARDPRVQRRAHEAQAVMKEKAGEAASQAAARVKGAAGSHGSASHEGAGSATATPGGSPYMG